MPHLSQTSGRYEGLPTDWSESVAETYVQIEEAHDLEAATTAALFEACSLLALADRMQAQVDADGLMIAGSAGRPVPHGLLTEIRLARAAAIGTLRALGVAPGQSAASADGAALAAKRHRGRTPGVRAVR